MLNRSVRSQARHEGAGYYKSAVDAHRHQPLIDYKILHQGFLRLHDANSTLWEPLSLSLESANGLSKRVNTPRAFSFLLKECFVTFRA